MLIFLILIYKEIIKRENMTTENNRCGEQRGGGQVKVIPAELRRVLDAEYYNGFGFQCSGLPEPEILVCWVSAPYTGGIEVSGVVEKTDSSWGDGMKLNLSGLESVIRSSGVSRTFKLDDFLGRNYLSVHYDEWECIPALINLCLNRGVRVNIGNKGMTVFHPRGCRNSKGQLHVFRPFNRRNLELAIIEQTEEYVASMSKYDRSGMTEYQKYDSHVRNACGGFGRNLWQCWNWTTPQGKAFCAKLRRILRKKRPVAKSPPRYTWKGHWETCAKYKVYHSGEWSAFEPSMITVDDLIPPPVFPDVNKKRKIVEISDSEEAEVVGGSVVASSGSVGATDDGSVGASDAEETDEKGDDGESSSEKVCMICMDAYPDTMVLPCEHQVVCRECSEGLRRTNDRRTCVRCRRVISMVLEDGGCREIV